MGKMVKKHYFIVKNDAGKATAECVEGYVVAREIAGRQVEFGIRRDGKSWTVDELGTGMSVNPGHMFGKRAEAMAYVDGEDEQTRKSLMETFGGYLEKRPYTYEAQVWAMQVLQQRKTPWPVKERNEYIDKRMKEFAERAGAVKHPEKATEEKEERMGSAGWVVWGTTKDGLVGWVSFSKLKTDKGAKAWLARMADADGTELTSAKAEFVDGLGERDAKLEAAKAELKALCDTVVTWTPAGGKSGLKSTWERKPLEKPPVTKQEPKATAPAAPKPPRKEEPKDGGKAAIEVSLASMRERFADEKAVAVTQKREGCPIWVEGDTKPFQAELKELGFRWAPKRKGWYYSAA